MARYKCPNCDYEADRFAIDNHLRYTEKQDHLYRCYCGFKHCDLGKDGMATHVKKCAEAQEKLPIGATKDLSKLQSALETIALPNATNVPLQSIQIEKSAQGQNNSATSGTGSFNFGNPAFSAAPPYGQSNQPSGPFQTPLNASSGLQGPPEFLNGQDYTTSGNFGARPTKRAKMSSAARDSPGTPTLQTKRGQKGKISRACADCARRKKKCEHRQSTQTDDGAVVVTPATAPSPASNVSNNLRDPFTASNQAQPMQPPFAVPFGSGSLPAPQLAQRSGPQPLQQTPPRQARKDSFWNGSQMSDRSYEQEFQKQFDLGEAFEQALATPGPDFSPRVPESFRSESSNRSTDNSSNHSSTNQLFSNHDLMDSTAGNDFANRQNQLMTGPLQPQQMLLLPQDEQQLPFANYPQQMQTSQQIADGVTENLSDLSWTEDLSWFEDPTPSDSNSGFPMPPEVEAEDDIAGNDPLDDQHTENTYPFEQSQEGQIDNTSSFQDPAGDYVWGDNLEYPPAQAEESMPRAYEQNAETNRAYVEANTTELPPQAPDWEPQAYEQNPNADLANPEEPKPLRNVKFPEYGYGFNEKGEIYDL